jgi:hypothetical protein
VINKYPLVIYFTSQQLIAIYEKDLLKFNDTICGIQFLSFISTLLTQGLKVYMQSKILDAAFSSVDILRNNNPLNNNNGNSFTFK